MSRVTLSAHVCVLWALQVRDATWQAFHGGRGEVVQKVRPTNQHTQRKGCSVLWWVLLLPQAGAPFWESDNSKKGGKRSATTEQTADGEEAIAVIVLVSCVSGRRTNLGTKAEPQQIVAQRLLSCLQYPVQAKSSTEDLTRPTFCFAM